MEQYSFTCRIPYSTEMFRASATVVFRNTRIIRIEITANGRTMKAEKYLYRKMNRWNVTAAEHSFFHGVKQNEMLLEEIFKTLDSVLS